VRQRAEGFTLSDALEVRETIVESAPEAVNEREKANVHGGKDPLNFFCKAA